jgi:biopolymer transport protein ExbD
MRFPLRVHIFRGQLEAAPFLGLFMLLLMLLLFSSRLVSVPGVPIQLPQTEPLPGLTEPMLVVAVDRHGQFYFEHQVCDPATLRARLATRVSSEPRLPALVVEADRDVRYEVLVRLSLLAREAGLKQVLLATRPAPVPELAPVRR